MKALWRVLGVALYNFITFRRQWMWVAQSIMFTVSTVLLVLGWGGSQAVKTLVPVYIVVSGWGFGLNIVGQIVGYDRISREWERLVASPLNLIEYLIGLTLGSSPLLLSGIFVLIVLAPVLGVSMASVAAALLLSLVAMVLGAFLALAIVLRIRNPMNISAITNPLATLTTFLPPVLYPPTIVPEPLRTALATIPTVSLAEITKLLAVGASAISVELCIASIATW
ncbi:MAG: ABC transporter permease, partial [Ignisphaera sp.]|nr:ABC transporter permease [Ignisphaera sp.]